MSHSQPVSISHNNPKADDSSTVFDADTVTPDEVPSLPPAIQEESPQSFTSVLLRRINSRHRPTEPSTTTATATATATIYDVNTVMPDQEESPATVTRSEEISRSNQHRSASSSSSKKRSIVTNSSVKRKQLKENSTSTTTKKSSTKRQRQNELKWKSKFEELCDYKRLHGNANVPQSNKELGNWVHTQRVQYKKFKKNEKSKITPERIQTLESIDFEWVSQNKGTPRNESAWNERFTELKAYKEEYKNTNVPRRCKDNKQLGKWVQTQRTEYKKFKKNEKAYITPERIKMLNSIGFQWECSPGRPPHS